MRLYTGYYNFSEFVAFGCIWPLFMKQVWVYVLNYQNLALTNASHLKEKLLLSNQQNIWVSSLKSSTCDLGATYFL